MIEMAKLELTKDDIAKLQRDEVIDIVTDDQFEVNEIQLSSTEAYCDCDEPVTESFGGVTFCNKCEKRVE